MPGTALGGLVAPPLWTLWRSSRALPRPDPHAQISEEPLGGAGGEARDRAKGSSVMQAFAVKVATDAGK